MRRSNDFFVIFADLAFLLFVSVVTGYVFVSVQPKQTADESDKAADVQVVGLDLPKVVSGQGQGAGKNGLEIRVARSGKLEIGGEEVGRKQLKGRIGRSRAKKCLLISDRRAPAESILQVFTSLQECGVGDIDVVYQEAK